MPSKLVLQLCVHVEQSYILPRITMLYQHEQISMAVRKSRRDVLEQPEQREQRAADWVT